MASATPNGTPAVVRGLLAWTGLLAALSLILKHGFATSSGVAATLDGFNFLLAGLYCWGRGAALVHNRRQWRVFVRRHLAEHFLALLFAPLLLVVTLAPAEAVDQMAEFLHQGGRFELYVAIVQLFLLGNLLVQLLRAYQRMLVRRIRPELVLASSFAILIAGGALLLLLPRASADPARPITLLDALFTSTSAACVTGLTVRDTGIDFSTFGQVMIMATFQLGGLGIMSFVAFLAVFSAESLPLPQVLVFKQAVGAPTIAALRRQIVWIFLGTCCIEAVGAAFLFQFLPPDIDPLQRLYWSVFHSISAFCNAGFGLESDSLVSVQSNAGMIVTFMALIVAGGIGFLVIPDLLKLRLLQTRWLQRFGLIRRLTAGQRRSRMSVQTKLSLVVTALLLVAGFLGCWALEAAHTLQDKPLGDSLLTAAFLSVTARTAGFNTVPTEGLQTTTLLLVIVLMVIGACPASTGGGIKTATFGVLLLAVRAMFSGNNRLEAFGRTVPQRVLIAALSVFVLYVFAAIAGLFFLALFDPQIPLKQEAFEIVSALSTVGLSTGITAQLSPASKLVLCLAMFIGRVGPIALVLAVFESRSRMTYEFPEEDLVVG